MLKATIHKLMDTFRDSFAQLGQEVPPSEIERLSVLIHSCMNGQARSFHTPEHLFQVCRYLKPVQKLAALFHDIVYYQVDEGFPEPVESLLLEEVEIGGDRQVSIRKKSTADDQYIGICLDVFGYQFGRQLSQMNGLNEFLSAIVACRSLSSSLSLPQMLAVIACIEGTIPFRENQPTSSFEKLYARLQEVNEKYNVGLSEGDLQGIVAFAVELANRDVENFRDENVGKFLTNTWMLLPENNSSLWAADVFSIRNYRDSLQKMDAFFRFLNPGNIYHSFQGTPTEEELGQMEAMARDNLRIAQEYLGVKLLTIAIIEALAITTGGDVPISMFLGTVYEDQQKPKRAEDFLPDVAIDRRLEYDELVMSLLVDGRSKASSFDLKNSPLSSYIYITLGREKVLEYIQLSYQMFDGDLGYEAFLGQMEKSIISAIAQACAEVAWTREEALRKYF